MTARLQTTMSLEDVKRYIHVKYLRGPIQHNRRMFCTVVRDGNGSVGTILFTIEGTPTQGMAVLRVHHDEAVGYQGLFFFMYRNIRDVMCTNVHPQDKITITGIPEIPMDAQSFTFIV